jgi:hypothetical protein
MTEMFSSQSKARVLQLSMQLNKAHRENKTADVYFNQIKNLADDMAAAGKPLEEDDVISYVVSCLNDEAIMALSLQLLHLLRLTNT